MTLVATKASSMLWPNFAFLQSAAPSIGTDQTITTGTYLCWVGISEQDMTIARIGFRVGTVNTSGVATAEVSIQSIDTSTGLPNGDMGGGSPTVTTTAAMTSNTWVETVLTNSIAVSAGTLFGIQVAYKSSTSFVIQRVNGTTSLVYNVPYEVVSGTPGRSSGTKSIVVANGSGTYYNLTNSMHMKAVTGGTFNSGTSDTKRGMAVTLPFGARLIGAHWYNGANAGTFALVVRDSGGSSLSSSTFGATLSHLNSASMQRHYLSAPVTLTAGTQYYMLVEPSSVTNVGMYAMQAENATYVNSGYPGLGSALYANYDGSYHINSDQIPFMNLILDQVDVGSSGARVIGG